ncbi:DUF4827 family protein [Muribaculaceae bacterium Isolate-104 (HZI)]|nr:DUF4827 family protein [Muribaculaceae bacterium Isolate-104 (HZI)]
MKLKLSNIIIGALAICTATVSLSCSDNKSYAELLEVENKAVNRFLADQRVIGYQEDFTDFEVGADAPFYQIDKEGNLYMQVIKLGEYEKPEDNQLVYFRFTRYNLSYYTTGGEMEGEGNSESIENGDQSFRMNNTTLESTTQWGSGIQHPLTLIPLGSEIKLVVKSQYGWTAEIAYVQPFLYHLRYYPGKI